MIRHVAVFRFVPEFTTAERQEWMRMLRALPAAIPELRSLTVGEDLVGADASHEMAIVADFDDLAGLDAYTRHPAHQEVLRVSSGKKASLATVDFEVTA